MFVCCEALCMFFSLKLVTDGGPGDPIQVNTLLRTGELIWKFSLDIVLIIDETNRPSYLEQCLSFICLLYTSDAADE